MMEEFLIGSVFIISMMEDIHRGRCHKQNPAQLL